ncbi:origin recognition complex subunit 4 C-terminus-domain-containing protein [Crepidotus variabilis]|uniref:Origin recognition complex subunit 4 n=1 Tax=Crepidotus variabilis TaxID=179855 RepID=A0A9P6ET17_9AGAR|nr:origin recognition complex subunit 4 C-terminus-domain-containing protein [Crepidotus variabilis]
MKEPKTPRGRTLLTKPAVEVIIRASSKTGTPVRHIPVEHTSDDFPRAQSPVSQVAQPIYTRLSRASNYLDIQKRVILQTLNQPTLSPPFTEPSAEPSTEDVARKQLNDLIHGTVARGEGNSCLLLGPRGSGKSMILDQTLAALAAKPIILRLSGFVQTSDKLALREIALQLLLQTGSSFLVEEDEPLLGQPNAENDDDENPFLVQTTVPKDDQPLCLPPSSQLHALIPILLTLKKPVIVILDAIDLFAMHPRQSLLYCLLDTVQSCHASQENRGIAVIGVTTRIDTIQLLEKRVKSRFSGRTIRTAPPSCLDDWLGLARNTLQLPIPIEGEDHDTRKWQQQWNSSVEDFLDHGEVLDVFNDTFSITKDVKVLQRLLTRTVLRLNYNEPHLMPKHLISSVDSQRTRPSTLHLNSLSYPTICLLIASVHTYAAGHNSFTFEMLFENFRDQLRSSTSAPVQVNGGHIGMAYDGLKSTKAFVATTAPSSSLAEGYVRHRSTLDRDVVKKIVEKSGQVHLKKWLIKGG